MSKSRLEAFSDGVIAIIITIMVLELRVPHGADWAAVGSLAPVLVSYVMSFVFIGVYWNNHHHMLHAATRVNGGILWANLHLLFWLSLIPFVTGWMGENHFAATPVGLYGMVLLMAGVAYYILSQALIAFHGQQSPLAKAVGRDRKGIISLVIYVVAVAVSPTYSGISLALYVIVTIMWLIPDRRIERLLAE
jgi:uncharacterized membrane protein